MPRHSLGDALAEVGVEFDVGFAQTPQQAVFVRRNNTVLDTHDGPLPVEWIFDLRLFHPDAEWHWWWDQEARNGRHSTLDDDVAGATSRGWLPLDESRRLLRGEVRKQEAGWTQLHDGHSRPLWVPFEPEDSVTRLVLGVVEYTARDAHGNVGVAAERFTQIKGY